MTIEKQVKKTLSSIVACLEMLECQIKDLEERVSEIEEEEEDENEDEDEKDCVKGAIIKKSLESIADAAVRIYIEKETKSSIILDATGTRKDDGKRYNVIISYTVKELKE